MMRVVVIGSFVVSVLVGCDRDTTPPAARAPEPATVDGTDVAPAPLDDAAPTASPLLLVDLRADQRDLLYRATSFLSSHCPEFEPPAVTGVSLADFRVLSAAWDTWVRTQPAERLDALEAKYQQRALLWSPVYGPEELTTPSPRDA